MLYNLGIILAGEKIVELAAEKAMSTATTWWCWGRQGTWSKADEDLNIQTGS